MVARSHNAHTILLLYILILSTLQSRVCEDVRLLPFKVLPLLALQAAQDAMQVLFLLEITMQHGRTNYCVVE